MRREQYILNKTSICAECGMRIEAGAYAVPSGHRHVPYVHPECADDWEDRPKDEVEAK